jgi:acetyl CoA:N6-hydroxylysine acetyl transferase
MADETADRLSLCLDGQPLLSLRLSREPALHVAIEHCVEHPDSEVLYLACYWLFACDPACQHLTWHLDELPTEALLSREVSGGGSSVPHR